LVSHGHVHYSVVRLNLDGADFFGTEDAQAATFNHGRATHSDVGVLRGDNHVATAQQGRVTGEASAGVDPDQWNQSAKPGPVGKGPAVETGDAQAIGIAGSPASSFGKEDDRQAG